MLANIIGDMRKIEDIRLTYTVKKVARSNKLKSLFQDKKCLIM